MANQDRIKRLIRRIGLCRQPFGENDWNDSPTSPTCSNWCEQNIGMHPKNILGHTIKLIDDEIQAESDREKSDTFKEMTNIRFMLGKGYRTEEQCAAWLGIPLTEGDKLFNQKQHGIKKEISRKTARNVLKILTETNQVDWKLAIYQP